MSLKVRKPIKKIYIYLVISGRMGPSIQSIAMFCLINIRNEKRLNDSNIFILSKVTSFLDGSAVYGSSEEESQALRKFSGGQLLTQEHSGRCRSFAWPHWHRNDRWGQTSRSMHDHLDWFDYCFCNIEWFLSQILFNDLKVKQIFKLTYYWLSE